MVAHRGDSSEVENTVESCLAAVRLGAHMVEVDVQLTADGELVVFHDWDLRRLGGGSGVVEELPASEVEGRPLRQSRSGRRLTANLPGLSTLLARLPPGLPLNLELKRRLAPAGRMVDRLVELLVNRGGILVSSFDWELLALVRRVLPEVPVAPIANREAEGLMAAGETLSAFSFHCHTRIAGALLAAQPGPPVLVYTVNRLAAARRWLGRGAAGVFTDHPASLLQGLL